MESISVVIPTYNRDKLLSDAIDSVLSQTVTPLEILVVDDGSTDSSASVLRSYGDKIRVIRQENSGVSVARNVGIRAARGSLIAFLDSDDVWLPDRLEQGMQCLERNAGVALVHSDVFLDSGGLRTRPRRGREKFSGYCYAQFFEESPAYPILSTVMVRATAIKSIGCFDEKLRTSEDIDLWLRISRVYPFEFIDEPLVLRRIHEGNLTSEMSKFFVTDLIVYEKALSEDPSVLKLAGNSAYFKRLGDTAYQAGYWTYKKEDQAAARLLLSKSIHYCPWKARAWILLFWTIIPKALRGWLLSLRAALSGG